MEGRMEKGRARAQRVVRAAAQAIADLGLDNVRVSDIAERAGMTSGHVTYYFPSKSDLLMLAVGEGQQALVDEVEKELTRIEDPRGRLVRYFELTAAKARGDADWLLWFQLWESAAVDERVGRAHAALDERWQRVLTDIVQYGVDRGAFASPDPALSARLISAMVDGLSIQLAVGAPDAPRAEMLHLCLLSAESFLGGQGMRPLQTKPGTTT